MPKNTATRSLQDLMMSKNELPQEGSDLSGLDKFLDEHLNTGAASDDPRVAGQVDPDSMGSYEDFLKDEPEEEQQPEPLKSIYAEQIAPPAPADVHPSWEEPRRVAPQSQPMGNADADRYIPPMRNNDIPPRPVDQPQGMGNPLGRPQGMQEPMKNAAQPQQMQDLNMFGKEQQKSPVKEKTAQSSQPRQTRGRRNAGGTVRTNNTHFIITYGKETSVAWREGDHTQFSVAQSKTAKSPLAVDFAGKYRVSCDTTGASALVKCRIPNGEFEIRDEGNGSQSVKLIDDYNITFWLSIDSESEIYFMEHKLHFEQGSITVILP